jgi:predicted metalloendopeptidase
MVDIGLNYF